MLVISDLNWNSLESEVSRMCNLSKSIERRAILSDLQALLSNTDWSLEQAMAMLNIPEEYRVIYANLLKESQ